MGEVQKNVYELAQERLHIIFKEFDNICVSFSGGKDSGVLLNLCIDYIRRNNLKRKLCVYHMDYEIQYSMTIDYVDRILEANKDILEVYRVCVPFKVTTCTSMYQNYWRPWDPEMEEIWVRQMPKGSMDVKSFPFYTDAMWDYEFQMHFAKWLHEKRDAVRSCFLIGIRTQESFNRWRSIHLARKYQMYHNYRWTSKIGNDIFNAYPIFDWKTTDIWVANGKFGWDYNHLYDLYYNTNNIPLSIQKMGVLSSTGLDIYRNIFGFDDKVIEVNYEENDDNDELFVYDKNILDLDLDSDKLNKDIKKYIKDNPGTSKNKYSGMFENKNLIFVVAESYSEIGVDEERTPTLYKLIHNGFTFDNFYVPYYLSTIGGEAQSLTGLYPNYATLTKWKSGENSFPYGLATVFKDKGYNTYAYHAHNGYFQNRYKYLKSLGFDNFKACNMGLNINCNMWPESDIEMIKATTNDYINSDKPFMTYYMTVSGHLDYIKEGNSIVSKNWDLVKNLDYSDKAKSYLATQIELDRAMESLLKELENKGILEDTVIVLLADHYPYGLSLEEINELSSYKRDELFEINHNSLVIYNSEMKNVNISKTGMPIDVLPTIYNLFNIRYDSRLFAGSDLLSNSEGMVILDNLSWITDRGRYNSLNGKYSGDIDSDYISNINNIIQNKIIFSRNMITYDGYRYIKEK